MSANVPSVGAVPATLVPFADQPCGVERLSPSRRLSPWVSHYWFARWDMRGRPPFLFENLPQPNVFAVFEAGGSRVYGAVTGKFSRLLEGRGESFGVAFRPGAFYQFLHRPVSCLRNTSIPASDVFCFDRVCVIEAVVRRDEPRVAIERVESLLLSLEPSLDENSEVVAAMAEYVAASRDVVRVGDVAAHFGVAPRTLERLFDRYVGSSAKWLIRYHRLREAAEYIATRRVVEWKALAVELGYFDQAHFINDFRTIVGRSPLEHAKNFA